MKTKIVLLVSFIVSIMTACSNTPDDWDKALLTITFEQKGFEDISSEIQGKLMYEVEIKDINGLPIAPASTIEAVTTIQERLEIGDYIIIVTAFDSLGKVMYAQEMKEVHVKAGQNYDTITINFDIKRIAMPTAYPPAGEIKIGATITLSTATPGAAIYYTLDGSEPSSSSALYTGAITISNFGVTMLKAIAIKVDMTDSFILVAEYTVLSPVAMPTANPPAGEVPHGTAISLSTATDGATIYYTLNGTEPSAFGTQYQNVPIILNDSPGTTITLKAIAVKDNMKQSETFTTEYTIIAAGIVTMPAASPSAGGVTIGTKVALSAIPQDAEIWYTTDGSTPVPNSVGIKYTDTNKITINAATTIRAIAVKSGMTNSGILTATYTILAVDTPAVYPPAGEALYGTAISLSTATDGATIYYTLNGTEPSASGSQYQNVPILLNYSPGTTITLKAIAVKDNMKQSETFTAVYTIIPAGVITMPAASPSAGGVTIGTKVALSAIPQDAEIWYTTDGSTPVPNVSTKYTDTNKITINAATTIRAIAVKEGMTNSNILTAAYTILSVATPTANKSAGTAVYGTEIILNTTTSGAEIYYTLNGTEPTTSSPKYPDVPIILNYPLNTKITLKAIAVKSDMKQSETFTVEYTILPIGKVATPVANPPVSEFDTDTKIILSTSTPDAEIWYTINGATPAKDGPGTKYTNPSTITISVLTTIRAIAVKPGWTDSETLVVEYAPAIKDMVWIKSGTFMMGSSSSEAGHEEDEAPQHQVTLTKGFYMGKYLVTQEQYEAVMGEGTNPSWFHGGSGREPAEGEDQARRPAEVVTWYAALVFCNKLSDAKGLTPAYSIDGSTNPDDWGTAPTSWDEFSPWNAVEIEPDSTGYRLPTEAQWEYACRAGTNTAYYTGDIIDDMTGWYADNSNHMTHQVGLKTVNGFGLYDMHGNVWEWCWDWYGSYSSEAQTDPLGAISGSLRVARGGSWNSLASLPRSAYRASPGNPYARGNVIGLRVVRP